MASTTSRIKPFALNIAMFNAFGLARQRNIFGEFLHDHNIDVMFVQESLLKPSDRGPRMANYHLIRNDRTHARGGGTAIYYRRHLHCMPIDPPSLTNIEASVCRLGMSGHPSIYLVSAYLPPDKQILQSDLNSLLGLGPSVIIAGDLNCKHPQWNCRATNRNGRHLYDLSISLCFDVVAPAQPTHFPNNINHRPDILDIALLKNVALPLRLIETINELDSDHRPVLLQLGASSPQAIPVKQVTDWKRLGAILASDDPKPLLDPIPDSFSSIEDTNLAIDALTSHLQGAIADATREAPVGDTYRWRLPEDVRELLTAKNAATRAHDRYPSVENRANLRALQREVKERITELRHTRWNSFLSDLSPSHQAYWKLAKSFKIDNDRSMPPLVGPDNSVSFDDIEKAECLAASLEIQCSPSSTQVDTDFVSSVDSEVERLASLPPSVDLAPVTTEEVTEIIRHLPTKKAPGLDGVSNRVLRSLPEQLIILLVVIFNATIKNCVFPDAWKDACVIGIPKPGKPKNVPTSYRPISLINTLGKLYERLLLNRLKDFILANNILIDEQFGFRTKHSCVHQVHRITEHILHNFSRSRKGSHTGAIFLDVAKAFDKVWHNGLIYKLYAQGVPDRLVLILRDYLSNRFFRYRVEAILSTPRPIRAGVPQGSILAPLLYSLYTNDVPKHPNVELALYADDTALYYSNFKLESIRLRLQDAVRDLGVWFRKWRIDVNPEKSVAILFSRVGRGPPTRKIRLFDRSIPWAKQVKYLGVILDNRLTFAPHIKAVRDRASFILGRLHHMVGRRSKLSLRNKLTLYKAVIRPVMTYASVVFAHSSPSSLKSLQVIQNKFMRNAVGAPLYMRNLDLHDDLKLETIASFMRNASRRFFDKALHHPNVLVRDACTYKDPSSFAAVIRRPRAVLTDPDDYITAALAAAPPNNTQVLTTRTNFIPRHRRRRRRRRRSRLMVQSTVANRCVYAPRRSSTPTQL